MPKPIYCKNCRRFAPLLCGIALVLVAIAWPKQMPTAATALPSMPANTLRVLVIDPTTQAVTIESSDSD